MDRDIDKVEAMLTGVLYSTVKNSLSMSFEIGLFLCRAKPYCPLRFNVNFSLVTIPTGILFSTTHTPRLFVFF